MFSTLRLILFALATVSAAVGRAPADFAGYWRSGQAEISRYALEQARYGELHRGEAVLIFVTEPFSAGKQVKLDDWASAPDSDRVEVLKLNATKKFLTGVYPYSMMNSVFTPVDAARHPRTLKTVTSVQEWCGQAWLQLNLARDGYRAAQYSYFEQEGDRSVVLRADLLEDEIWTRLRLAPASLPSGDVRLVPGGFVSRLLHLPLEPVAAQARFADLPAETYPGQAARAYELAMPSVRGRTLAIHFAADFPHAILGWIETYRDTGDRVLTTRAVRTATARLDYWNRNRDADRTLRASLGLRAESP